MYVLLLLPPGAWRLTHGISSFPDGDGGQDGGAMDSEGGLGVRKRSLGTCSCDPRLCTLEGRVDPAHSSPREGDGIEKITLAFYPVHSRRSSSASTKSDRATARPKAQRAEGTNFSLPASCIPPHPAKRHVPPALAQAPDPASRQCSRSRHRRPPPESASFLSARSDCSCSSLPLPPALCMS